MVKQTRLHITGVEADRLKIGFDAAIEVAAGLVKPVNRLIKETEGATTSFKTKLLQPLREAEV